MTLLQVHRACVIILLLGFGQSTSRHLVPALMTPYFKKPVVSFCLKLTLISMDIFFAKFPFLAAQLPKKMKMCLSQKKTNENSDGRLLNYLRFVSLTLSEKKNGLS